MFPTTSIQWSIILFAIVHFILSVAFEFFCVENNQAWKFLRNRFGSQKFLPKHQKLLRRLSPSKHPAKLEEGSENRMNPIYVIDKTFVSHVTVEGEAETSCTSDVSTENYNFTSSNNFVEVL